MSPFDQEEQSPLPSLNPEDFSERMSLFPSDRPDIPISPQVNDMVPEEKPVLGVSQAVDMEVIDMVMGRYELSKTWRRPWRLVWDKCWQHMKGVYDTTGKEPWQSSTFMPLTSKVVEVIVSNLHSAVFGPEMPVEWQSKRTDKEDLVRSINEVVKTDFDKCNAKAEFTDFLRNMAVTGVAIGEVSYIKQRETVMVKQKQNMPPQMMEMIKGLGIEPQASFVPQEMLVKDYATIKNIDPYDIYPEPRKPEFSKDSWVIHKSKITNRELKMGSQDPDEYYRFDNVTNDLLQGSGQQRTDVDPEKQTRRYTLMDYNAYTHFLEPDREHELYTYYGQIPLWYLQPELRNDPERQYDSVPGCIKVVDGQWVIWKRISPWRDGEPPYFKGSYIRIPGEFYGIGVAELVMGLQIEKNEIRNSRMDNINMSMNKIIAVLKDKVPNGEWKRLVSQPGGIWMFKGVEKIADAFKEIEMGNVTQDSWQASREVDIEAQEVTAANKDTQAAGGTQDSPSTFRGQMLNIQQATGRWMLYARLFEWMGFVPAMKKFYQRIYQFKDLKDIQEILGPGRSSRYEEIAPEELEKIAKLIPLGVMTMENKGVKLAQMSEFAKLWGQDPFFKRLEYARKMAVEQGDPEPDQYLFSDEEMKVFNEQRNMMMKETEAMGMSGLVDAQGQPMPKPMLKPGPVAGNLPGPRQGMPRPASPARGPGASAMDLNGRPVS